MEKQKTPLFIESKEGLLLSVKVTPGAKLNKIMGWEEGVLKIRVTAPPEKGQANHAVVLLLAKTLQIPQRNIILVHGASSRSKQFCLMEIKTEEAKKFLSI